MNGLENFTFGEWCVFVLAFAVVLYLIYPKGNGRFENECYKTTRSKEKHWWEKEDQGK